MNDQNKEFSSFKTKFSKYGFKISLQCQNPIWKFKNHAISNFLKSFKI